MNDHETYLLLAAKRVSERLTPVEVGALEEHLARCPSCRATASGMRRDDIILRAALSPVAVSPRVRERILEQAAGGRRLAAGRIGLLLAATLVIAAISVPLIAGALGPPEASGTPSAIATDTPSPSLAPSSTPVSSASVSPSVPAESAQPSPTVVGIVNGSYTYSDSVPRRAAISGRTVDGQPDGAWSRRVPATGVSKKWNGTITCLVIDGADAWIAGAVTDSTDGVNRSIFIRVHDGGRNGKGDRVTMWLNDHGETLPLLEGWCREKFTPGPTYPLTSGDIAVDANGS